ncbi:MAG: amino acid permease, partial [Deltaproteobacteria bacterium]|nr:amino acid permease [Deltaproteobacteria bacterium]
FDAGMAGGFLFALIPVYFAYTGWDASTYVGSELKAPRSGIPRSIARGIFSIILIYLAMNAAYIFAVPPSEMKDVQAIGSKSAGMFFGETGATLFTILILISIAGCVSAVILTAPRIYFAMANNGLFFKKCSAVHPVHKTPHVSIIVQGIWASLLVLTGTVEELLVWVTVVILFMDILLMGALFAVRRKKDAAVSRETYRTPLYPLTPALFIAATSAILINVFMEKPLESIAGAAILAAGIPFYLFFKGTATK